MNYSSTTGKLTLLKSERETLAKAEKILQNAGRIIGLPAVCKAADMVGGAIGLLGGSDNGTLPNGEPAQDDPLK